MVGQKAQNHGWSLIFFSGQRETPGVSVLFLGGPFNKCWFAFRFPFGPANKVGYAQKRRAPSGFRVRLLEVRILVFHMFEELRGSGLLLERGRPL